MPPVIDGDLAEVGQPHHHMRCADVYFMIAAGAAIGFQRTCTGYRPHLVVMPVRARLDAARGRQRRMRRLPTR
jgi:hypothetical protein